MLGCDRLIGHEMHWMASGAAMPESARKMIAEIRNADISGGRPAAQRKASW